VHIRIKSSSYSQFGAKVYVSISFTFLVLMIFFKRFYGESDWSGKEGSDETKIFIVKSDKNGRRFSIK